MFYSGILTLSDNIYNNAFYDLQSKESYNSALVVLALLKKKLGERVPLDSVIDFGCGVGSWLAAAKKVGFNDVCGTDGSYVPKAKLMIEESEFFENDLANPLEIELPDRKFDLAITLEVAEHLPEQQASNFINTIVDKANFVLFSAAIPYQGGHGHVNENWLEYWQGKFHKRGYIAVDFVRPEIWYSEEVCWWYKQNLVLFVNVEQIQHLPPGTPLNQPLSLVHPEQFITAVHREKTSRQYTNQQDKSYFRALAKQNYEKIYTYGKEYSYVEDKKNISTLAQLKDYAMSTGNSVVLDAVSTIKPQKNISPLGYVNKPVPDFLCVGAQKSGTTWLHEFLSHQTELWLPPIKELNFFNRLSFDMGSAFSGEWARGNAIQRLHQATKNPNIDQNWLKFLFHFCEKNVDLDWYLKIFERAPKKRLLGEITPEYMYLPAAMINEINKLNPKMKILFVLRHPIDRIFSQYKMIKRNCKDLSDDLTEVVCNLESVVERSNYSKYIANWKEVFGSEQVYVGNFDKLQANPKAFLQGISKFLDIEFDYSSEVLHKRIHVSKESEVNLDFKCIKDYDKLTSMWKNLEFST